VSRTYKKIGFSRIFRNPRGHKQALIDKVRPKARPPDAWEDIQPDKQCFLPINIAKQLREKGIPEEVVRRKLKKKFRLSNWEISLILTGMRGMW
jgi:hypothetical protein